MSSPRERLIISAIALVRQHGVAGTGITELLAHAGAARRSVYQNFPGGKAQLIEESTRAAGQVATAVIAGFTAADDPRESLAGFVALWKDTLVTGEFESGCPVVAAAMGRSEAPGATIVADTVFSDWTALIAAQLRRSGIAEGTADSLASMVVCAVEGAVVLAVAARSVRPLDDVEKHVAELVRMHRSRVEPAG
ncbi:TetR/AcrR family transcriptional regulator [Nocardia sp. IBHARD005]|uniref:TetR/AcrR family transcriptional regulator n=1 Tax=Nocardia sp. IBHARD005 TaxID=3457765 RepID=UPI004059ECFE